MGCAHTSTVTTTQVLDFSVCSVVYNIPTGWSEYATVPQFILGSVLCILVVFQFVRQSYRMYRATKQWQPNRYMSLLVREGVLYFLM